MGVPPAVLPDTLIRSKIVFRTVSALLIVQCVIFIIPLSYNISPLYAFFACRFLISVQTCNFTHNQTTSERLGRKRSNKGGQKAFDSGTTEETDENGALLRDSSVDISIKQSRCFLMNCFRMIKGSHIIDQDQLYMNCTERTMHIKQERT